MVVEFKSLLLPYFEVYYFHYKTFLWIGVNTRAPKYDLVVLGRTGYKYDRKNVRAQFITFVQFNEIKRQI